MVYSSKLAEQYAALKAEARADCVLLMQVGSFMQVQAEDARAVSDVTGLKLRMAGDVDAPVVWELGREIPPGHPICNRKTRRKGEAPCE